MGQLQSNVLREKPGFCHGRKVIEDALIVWLHFQCPERKYMRGITTTLSISARNWSEEQDGFIIVCGLLWKVSMGLSGEPGVRSFFQFMLLYFQE